MLRIGLSAYSLDVQKACHKRRCVVFEDELGNHFHATALAIGQPIEIKTNQTSNLYQEKTEEEIKEKSRK